MVARAYVDAKGGPGGSTPLHLAAAGGHTATLRLLIAERAGVDIPDGQGRKAMSVCKTEEAREAMRSALVKTACHGPSCTAEGPGLQPEVRARLRAARRVSLVMPPEMKGAGTGSWWRTRRACS